MVVEIDNLEAASINAGIYEFDLNDDCFGILHIPGRYANGFKPMTPNSKVIIFSNFTGQQALNDIYKFDQNRWLD